MSTTTPDTTQRQTGRQKSILIEAACREVLKACKRIKKKYTKKREVIYTKILELDKTTIGLKSKQASLREKIAPINTSEKAEINLLVTTTCKQKNLDNKTVFAIINNS